MTERPNFLPNLLPRFLNKVTQKLGQIYKQFVEVRKIGLF